MKTTSSSSADSSAPRRGSRAGASCAKGEISPAPQEGEWVIFRSHCLRGLGLPASSFFRSFLEFHGLQPHHLTPNAVVLLSAFVAMCEGFLGVLPTLEFWGLFFFSKLGT